MNPKKLDPKKLGPKAYYERLYHGGKVARITNVFISITFNFAEKNIIDHNIFENGIYLAAPKVRKFLQDKFGIEQIEDYNFYDDDEKLVNIYRPFKTHEIAMHVYIVIKEKD